MGDFTPGIMGVPIMPGVSEGEVQTLDTVIRVTSEECKPPTKPLAVPEEPLKELFAWMCTFARSHGAPIWMARLAALAVVLPVAVVNNLISALLSVLAPLTSAWASEGLALIDVFRKQIDPTVAKVGVEVLNELLGTELQSTQLSESLTLTGHIARAEEVGSLFFNTITREISPGTDLETVNGRAGAERFAGMIVNFGVATALLGLFGELGTLGFIKNFRLIGEQVSSGLGLSKQMRIAMKPLMKTLVATPFQWELNKEFHPARFTSAEVVNPFLAVQMDHDLIVKDLELQGFDAVHAEALIRLHSKRVTVADVELFSRYGTLSSQNAVGMLKDLGYLEDVATLVLKAEDLRRADTAVRKLIDEMEARVIAGDVAVEDFSTLLDNLPLGPIEKRFILDVAQFKKNAPHAHLTTAQAQKAFEEGIWDLDQLTNYFRARGFTEDDNATLQIETLLALAKLAEAEAAKKKKADAAAARAAAKAAKTPKPVGG